MKNFIKKGAILINFILLISRSYGQVSIDKKVDMTGATNDDRRIINVGDVVAASDAVNAQTLQKGSLIYVVANALGTPDAIIASTIPSFIPQAGTTINLKAISNNTGSVTLNLNGAGPFTIYKNATIPLIADEIKAGQVITATFDGNNWQIGGSDNLGNHQATQTITANTNDTYDIGNGTNGFKDAYFTGSVKLDNVTFISNGGNTNTFLGETQNTTNSATDNIFIGYQTGKNNTSGYGNIFAGYQTGFSNTGGAYNIMMGYQSGYNNINGYANTFLGYQSGFSNTTGSYNYFSGIYAGNNNISGNDNIAIGYLSGYLNSTGNSNISLGNSAGVYNTANQNIFIGNGAGYLNNSGSNNIDIGYQAGYGNTTGDANTSIGYHAGFSNSSGARNTYVGYNAAYSLASGSDNIFIGAGVAPSISSGSENILIGNGAGTSFGFVTYSNSIAIGRFANIGASTTYSIALGSSSSAFGNNSTAIGGFALVNTNATNSTAIGYIAQANTSNTVAIGNSSVTSWIFGRTSSVNGTAIIVGTNGTNGNGAYLTSGGVWTNTSDKNKKENFTSMNGQEILSKINQLKITQWNYKGEDASIKHIGPMAQDFYKLFKLGNDDKSISTIDPAGIALIAIQELDKKDKELEEKIKEIEILKSRLETSESKIDLLSEQLNEIKLLLHKEDKKEAMK